MIRHTCRACPTPHAMYIQATPEISAPRRETPADFWWALATWTLVIAAYVAGAYALAGMAS